MFESNVDPAVEQGVENNPLHRAYSCPSGQCRWHDAWLIHDPVRHVLFDTVASFDLTVNRANGRAEYTNPGVAGLRLVRTADGDMVWSYPATEPVRRTATTAPAKPVHHCVDCGDVFERKSRRGRPAVRCEPCSRPRRIRRGLPATLATA